MGSKKAAVFQVPVCADPIRSLPAKMTGIACSWMGVADSKPIASMPCNKSGWNPSSLNFNAFSNYIATI